MLINRQFSAYRTRGLVLGAALLAATLAVPGSALAATFMSEKELLATIPGHVVDGKTDKGVRWVQSYSAYQGGKKKGTIKGIFNDQKFDSKWFVQNGQWCEDWGDGHACWQVERVDEKSLRMYADGKPRPNLWVLR